MKRITLMLKKTPTLKMFIYVAIFSFLFYPINSFSNQTKLFVLDQKIISIDSLGVQQTFVGHADIDLNFHKIYEINNENYLLNYQSGLVYKIVKDSIVRYDNSYDDKIHNFSLDFVYNDTLYRFGGYGYYHTHKTLTYFDESTKQWDLVKYEGFSKIDGFSNVGFSYIFEDKLYVLGYDTLEKDYQNQHNFLREGFVYDLAQKKIVKKMKLNKSFVFPDYYVDLDQQYVFLFYRNKKTMKIFRKSDQKFFSFNLNLEESSIGELNQKHTKINNNLFFQITDNNLKQKIISINWKSIIENKKETNDDVFEKKNTGFLVIIFVLLLLMLAKWILRKQSKSKLQVQDNYLLFKGNKITLEERDIAVIRLLLQKRTCTSNELNEIFFKPDLNPIHINRMKNESIRKINAVFQNKHKAQLIILTKSSVDKRLNQYSLNRSMV